MVVQEHPAWPQMPEKWQAIDQAITQKLGDVAIYPAEALSERENQVLQLAADGHTIAESKSGVHLSHTQVSRERVAICGKLNAATLTAAVYNGCHSGLTLYEPMAWPNSEKKFTAGMALVLKLVASGQRHEEIAENVPGLTGSAALIGRAFVVMDATNAPHFVRQAYALGLFAPAARTNNEGE